MLRFTCVQIIMAAQIVHLAVNFLRCQDPSTHRCCSPFLSTCCWVVFLLFFLIQYAVDSCTLGKYKTGPELCDKFLWPVVAVSFKKDFLFHMTPNLFVVFFWSDVFLRIERVSASFYQMVCIYKRTVCLFFFSACNTQLGFFGSFGSLECRWCKREKRRGG